VNKIINLYLFKQLSFASLGITLALTAAIWLTQSLRFLDFIVNRGISLGTFIKFILLLLPDLISIILPIGTLIGTLFVFNRLYVDSEWVVFKALGLSHLKIATPALFFAGAVITFLYSVNLYFLPLSFQKFKDLEHSIRNNTAATIIQPGEFNTFKGITFYARQRQSNGVLKGILIYDARDPRKEITIAAEQGILLETPEDMRFVLLNGNRQEHDSQTGQPNLLSFNEYTLDIVSTASDPKERQRKPHERFLSELLNPVEIEKGSLFVGKLKAEAHQRLLMPFIVLGFILISLSIFQKGEYNRRGRIKRISMAVILCTFFEAAMLGLVHLSEKLPSLIWLAYTLCGSVCVGAFLLLIERPGGLFKFEERK
jgi:lipopolysaccharide export system permease protein